MPCMRWAADEPRFTAWGGHIVGHHLKWQYIDHTEDRLWKGGGENVLYRDVNSHSRFSHWQENGQLQPLFLGLPVELSWQLWEGCVLFYSSFPKINVVHAGDNHRAAVVARWPGPSLPHPAAFCQPKKTAFTAQNSHRTRKNRRKADTKANVTQCVCIRWKRRKLWSFFINAGGSRSGGGGWISKFTCGRMLWRRYL